jgi:hypothetical protein
MSAATNNRSCHCRSPATANQRRHRPCDGKFGNLPNPFLRLSLAPMKSPCRHLFLLAAGISLACLASTPSSAATQPPDAAVITDMLMKRFDRPDAHLVVQPLVIEGDAAIADWIQGDQGGRALLRRQQGQWSLVLCGGDGLTHADVLIQAGVAPGQARALADHLAQAERQIAPSTLTRLKQFPGIVPMRQQ